MRHAGIALAILVCVAPCSLPAQTQLSPQTYSSHFQPNAGADPSSGSRDGWESFPVTQETGYEPTLQPETRDGSSMLVREAAPTRAGDMQLGFVRRLHMVAGDAAHLSFSVRVPWATGATPIAVTVFRGDQEERISADVQGAAWQSLQFQPAHSQVPITAIAIAADFPKAVPGRNERVELRDVALSGLGIAMLPLREPEVLTDTTRRVLYMRDGLHLGETLHAVAAIQGDAQVAWTLTAPDNTVRAHGQGARVEHHFAASDPVGIWTLRIDTPNAEATMRLLLTASVPSPLLFSTPPNVSPGLLASIRKRRDELRAVAHVASGNNIAKMDAHWLLAGLPSYFDALLQSTELAMLDAIDYRSSGDEHSLAEAQQLLQGIAAWPTWTHPWFPAHGYHSYYPVGIAAKYVVIAEQFLGNDLQAATRSALDVSLLRNMIVPVYTEYVAEDRLQFNYSNWIGNTAGGALLAAAQSRQPGVAGYALGLFEKERDHVGAAYTKDGSYGEGATYHRFDFEMTSLVAELSKRQFGLSLDDHFAKSEQYLAYAHYGKDGLLDYGDSHVDVAPSNVFAYVAALNASDAMTEFYFRFRDTGTAELLSRVLWEAEIQPPQHGAANKPASMVFSQRGIAVFRDGWSEDATVVAMRAGKNFNHNHADQGSVFYAKDGALWLGEAGYADYYKDPSYNTYNIQAAGHNVLLVDSNPESQIIAGNGVLGKSPEIQRAQLNGPVQVVEADLKSAYSANLDAYTRTIVFAPQGVTVVIDRVRSASPHRLAQRWHPVQPFTRDTGNAFTMRHSGNSVRVEAFATVPMATNASEAPLPLASYDLAGRQEIERPRIMDFATKESVKDCIIATVISDGSEHAVVTHEGDGLHLRYGRLDVSVRSTDSPVEARWIP